MAKSVRASKRVPVSPVPASPKSYAGPRYQCKLCMDIIQSQHRHDFVWCRCKATAIDGGSSYTKLTNYTDLVRVEDDKP